MNDPSNNRSQLRRLVQTVRRRWVVVRAVEAGLIGLSAGAVVCFALIAVMWWHERPSLAGVGALLAFAGSTGAAISLLRLPTPVQTARRIDQQHGLSDLFSTAITLERRDDPAIAAVIQHLANESAGRLARQPVAVARFGEAAYAVVALAASLAVGVAAVASQGLDGGVQVDRSFQERDPAHARNPASARPAREALAESPGALSVIFARASESALDRKSEPDAMSASAKNSKAAPAAAHRDGQSSSKTPAQSVSEVDLAAPTTLPPKPSPDGEAGGSGSPVWRDDATRAVGGSSGQVETRPSDAVPTPPAVMDGPPKLGGDSGEWAGYSDAYRELIRGYFRRD